MKNIKNKFIDFLKENRAYKQFIQNIPNQDNKDIDLFYLKNIKKGPSFLISGAFEWNRTKEGILFWGNLSEKWENIIK